MISPFVCSVTLVKLLNISDPCFTHLKMGVMLVLPLWLVVKTHWDNSCKELSRVLAHCKLSGHSYYFLLRNMKYFPSAYLTANKIFCLIFQAYQKLVPTVTSPTLPYSPKVYIARLSP